MPDKASIESFNGKFRAECLNAHWFMSLVHWEGQMEGSAKRFRCGACGLKRVALYRVRSRICGGATAKIKKAPGSWSALLSQP
jgi:hypothetical protein